MSAISIGNKIGSQTGTSTIVINATSITANTLRATGIIDISQSDDIISNNEMGSITINSGGTGNAVGFEGIQLISFPGQNITVNGNLIGGTVAGSITDNILGNYLMQGIDSPFIFTGGSGTVSCTGNIIRNMVSNSNVTGFITMRGICPGGQRDAEREHGIAKYDPFVEQRGGWRWPNRHLCAWI